MLSTKKWLKIKLIDGWSYSSVYLIQNVFYFIKKSKHINKKT